MMTGTPTNDLRVALAALRASARRAQRAAADAVEEIDPTFPTWTIKGEPHEMSEELRSALGLLAWLVQVEKETEAQVVALEKRLRRRSS